MPIKSFKPTTPSRRHMKIQTSEGLSSKETEVRSLKEKKHSPKGRNNQGRITSRRRGGGSRRKYRVIDFKRNKFNIEGRVDAIHYDPNRSCRLALITYIDGEKRYILAPLGLNIGDKIIASDKADIKVGNSKCLKDIPVGTLVHNIELNPGAGGQMARSAGTYAQLMAKENADVLLRMPSGELRKVKKECRATVGQVGNLEHENVSLGKAGKSRHLGKRPSVRGVAMNPVDHPHGGGEGRTSGGRHPVTPWGVPTKGYKTRKNKRTDRYIVKRRK